MIVQARCGLPIPHEAHEHGLITRARCPGVREVHPPDQHDYRRVRCAPEGHFVAVGKDRCDCGIERMMLP